MSTPKSKIAINPRGLTFAEVAKYYGHSEEWLRIRHPEYVLLGFPDLHPLFDRYDVVEVDRFFEQTKSSKSKRSPTKQRKRRDLGSHDTLIERAKKGSD